MRKNYILAAIGFLLLVVFTGGVNGQTVPADYIPKYAVEEAERFKASFLRENSHAAADLTYRFFYNTAGHACLEYTVTAKNGYTWERPTWVGFIWENTSGSIGNNEIKYTRSAKLDDAAQYRIEERRKDPVFRDIEKVVLQIATEYNYDYESAYRIRVKYRRPNTKKAVCDGYSDAVTQAFKNHPQVTKVEKWSSTAGNHAWNVLVLKDGRRLYCDTTWYDGNNIDADGYVVDIPVQNPVNLTFDIDEFNSLGGAVNNATGRLVATHFAWPDARMVN